MNTSDYTTADVKNQAPATIILHWGGRVTIRRQGRTAHCYITPSEQSRERLKRFVRDSGFQWERYSSDKTWMSGRIARLWFPEELPPDDDMRAYLGQ